MAKKNALSEATETSETEEKTVSTETSSAEEKPAEMAKEKKPEAMYTADEFAGAAGKLFGKKYNADLVRAAFKVAGIESATKTEATQIVKEFAERKVK